MHILACTYKLTQKYKHACRYTGSVVLILLLLLGLYVGRRIVSSRAGKDGSVPFQFGKEGGAGGSPVGRQHWGPNQRWGGVCNLRVLLRKVGNQVCPMYKLSRL